MRFSCVVLVVLIILVSSGIAMAGAPEYPSTFPKAFPQFKGCKMVQLMSVESNKSAMLDCGKIDAEKISSFYLEKAKKAGWKVILQNQAANFSMLMMEKGKTAMQIHMSNEKGATQLGMSYINK